MLATSGEETEQEIEKVAFVGRLCKQKFFQGFRRVRVMGGSEETEERGRERCAKEERVM